MKRFNHFEFFIAKFLSSTPLLKFYVKKIYLIVCYFLFNRKINANYETFNDCNETFFGYYDSSPESKEYVIYHETIYSTKNSPSEFDYIYINIFDKNLKKVIKKIKTKAFNWQQGSRIFWLDNYRFIYNDFECKYVSKLYDIRSDITRTFDYPVQAVSDEFFVSLDYNLLKSTRPDYGYFCVDTDYIFSNDNVAFSVISFDNVVLKSVFFSEIIEFIGLNVKDNYEVNHFFISSSDLFFMFRWYVNGVRNDVLLKFNLNTDNFTVLLNNKMVSHYCLLPNNQILVYANDIDLIPKYLVLSSDTADIIRSFISPFGDGHPTLYKNNKVIIDTYPNRNGYQYLLIFDYVNGSFEKLLDLNHSPLFFGESRCDLHPRYSSISNSVFFDTVSSGKRSFAKLRLFND